MKELYFNDGKHTLKYTCIQNWCRWFKTCKSPCCLANKCDDTVTSVRQKR